MVGGGVTSLAREDRTDSWVTLAVRAYAIDVVTYFYLVLLFRCDTYLLEGDWQSLIRARSGRGWCSYVIVLIHFLYLSFFAILSFLPFYSSVDNTNVTMYHHLISQAGLNRCNLSIYLCFSRLSVPAQTLGRFQRNLLTVCLGQCTCDMHQYRNLGRVPASRHHTYDRSRAAVAAYDLCSTYRQLSPAAQMCMAMGTLPPERERERSITSIQPHKADSAADRGRLCCASLPCCLAVRAAGCMRPCGRPTHWR